MTKLLKQLGIDSDFGTIKFAYSSAKINTLEMIGDPCLVVKPGKVDEAVAISQKAPVEANAYIVGSVSDPVRKTGTDAWTRDYSVQFYKTS